MDDSEEHTIGLTPYKVATDFEELGIHAFYKERPPAVLLRHEESHHDTLQEITFGSH